MNNLVKLTLFAIILGSMPVMAQPPVREEHPEGECPNEQGKPMRTPEEEASRLTENLQRELGLTPQQRESVYNIHLKYAILRRDRMAVTRPEAVQRMNDMTDELLNVLSHEQQQEFLKRLQEPRKKTAHISQISRDSLP